MPEPQSGGKGDPPSSELVRPSGNLTLEGEIPRGLRKWLLGERCSVGRRERSGGLACPEQTNWPQPLAPSAQHPLSAGAASGTPSWPPAGEGAASAPTQAAGWQSLSTFPCQPVTGKLLNCAGPPLNSETGMLLSEELGCEINEREDAQQGAE